MVDPTSVGLLLIIAGIAVIAMATVSSSGPEENRTRGAGVLLLGPIPLIFGSDAKWAIFAVALAIVLMLLVMLT